MVRSFVLLLTLAVIMSFEIPKAKAADKCIEGSLHKKSPSPEGANYAECLPWKDNSCCTAEFTIELRNHRVDNLYNFTWHHCRNLSRECETFIKNEECFFQCEPNLIKWHLEKWYVKHVPICAWYCNAWFDACKYDMTCVQDWLSGFNFTSSSYICPLNSKCRTFSEFYKNGKGLCNTMWGPSFKYEDTSNCMVMNFTGPNPNTKVFPITNGGGVYLSATGFLIMIASYSVVFALP